MRKSLSFVFPKTKISRYMESPSPLVFHTPIHLKYRVPELMERLVCVVIETAWYRTYVREPITFLVHKRNAASIWCRFLLSQTVLHKCFSSKNPPCVDLWEFSSVGAQRKPKPLLWDCMSFPLQETKIPKTSVDCHHECLACVAKDICAEEWFGCSKPR